MESKIIFAVTFLCLLCVTLGFYLGGIYESKTDTCFTEWNKTITVLNDCRDTLIECNTFLQKCSEYLPVE